VRLGPVAEGAGRAAGDVADVGADAGLIQSAVGVEAEERGHVLGGHGLAHLGPGLVIWLRHEGQGPAQDLAENGDPVGGPQRLGTGQGVGAARVPGRGEGDRRHRRDVMRIDDRDRHVRPRRADHVAGLELTDPLQRVRHEAERAQESPRQPGVPDRLLGVHHVLRDGVARLAALDRAA